MMADTIHCIASTITRTIAFSDGLTTTLFTWCLTVVKVLKMNLFSCVKVPSDYRPLIQFDKKDPLLKKYDHLCFKKGEHKRVQAKQGQCRYCAYLYLKTKASSKNKDDWPKVKKPMLACSTCKL